MTQPMHRVRIVAVASWTLITTGLKLNRSFIGGNARRQHGIFKGWMSIRAHNLCHDNRQLIVIAINRNRSAIKINCN